MIARHLAYTILLIALCSLPIASPGLAADKVKLQGSGASFPFSLYGQWFKTYSKKHRNVTIDYQAKGSGAGIKDFMNRTVDFAASDAAMTDEEMAAVTAGVQLLPMTAGEIVLAYNLPTGPKELKLSREPYAKIFLGKIMTWNDLRIQATNPGLNLPGDNIAIAVRSDSSGTTFAFTNHLSAISPEWRDRGPSAGTVIDWPGNAMAARGNEGVAGRIQQSQGSIGYVEYGTAQRAGLRMAWLENKAGQFIQPHGGSGLATLLNTEMPDNLRVFFPDPAGQDSYPIVTYSWLLLYKTYDDPVKLAALKQYVKWCLTEGQAFNEGLGYVRLAPHVVARATAAVDRIQ
jgi:phosphate transport system substrate-binding protein